MKTVLLTGSSGFIGSNLKHKLEELGYNVITYSKAQWWKLGFYPSERIDAIIHAAAELKNSSLMYDANVEYTQQIIEYCVENKVKLIHIGSSSEYGPVEEIRFESRSCNPSDYYGITKYIGTQLVLGAVKEWNLDGCIIRPFTVYGPGEQSHKFIPRIFDAYVNNTEMIIHPGAHDWIYIDDFVDGVIKALESDRVRGQIINLGSGTSVSNFVVIEMFEKLIKGNIKYKINHDKYHKYDVDFWCASNYKAKELLNWSPMVSFEVGLNNYIMNRWFSEDRG